MPSLYDIAQDPAAENPLIALWLRQQAQQAQDPTQADRQLAAQGANVRSADISAAQSPIVQKLLGQGMTRGLSQDKTNPTNESGLTYSGPVAGYGGPTRASDTQPVHVKTAHNQAELDNILTRQEIDRLPGPGGKGTMGQALDLLGVTKVPGLVNSQYPGLVSDPEKVKLQIAQINAAARLGLHSDAAQRNADENISQYYNKQTGKPAVEDFPSSTPDVKTLNDNYVRLRTDSQRNALDAARGLDAQIQNYQDLVDKLPLPAKEGIGGSIASGLGIKALRAAQNPDVRELDAAKAQIIALARQLGGTSKSADSIREVQRLEAAVITDFDTKESAQKAVDMLKRFRDNKVQTLPVPGLHNRYYTPDGKLKQNAAPVEGPTAPQANGRVTVVSPDGKRGSIPANQLQDALNAGYKQAQ